MELADAVTTSPESAADTIPPAFFDRMVTKLTEFVGPMAPMVAHDQIAALGESPEAFPQRRFDELIKAITAEIPDKDLKVSFQKQISEEMRQV